MLRVAYFSPLNPVRSGISDYSEDLLPYLAPDVEVDLFVDSYSPASKSIVERYSIYPIEEYPQLRWDYDVPLYHMGNNLYHEAIYRTAVLYPGVVVLHDFALAGLLGSMTLERGDPEAFVREWLYAHGHQALSQMREILGGQAALPADEPMNQRLLDLSVGIVVHSDYLRRQVLKLQPQAHVVHIPMQCVSQYAQSFTMPAARRALGLEEDGLYVGCFGFLAPSKQVEPLLDVFGELINTFPSAQLLFVGEPLDWFDPQPLIERRGLSEHVTVTGYLPLRTWYTYIAAVDLAVNLRYPTLGETSAAVLRLLGEGVPTIVSDVGWYAELPDDCVVKIGIGASMQAELTRAIVGLLTEPGRRKGLGESARAYVKKGHAPEKAAQYYVRFLSEIVSGFRF